MMRKIAICLSIVLTLTEVCILADRIDRKRDAEHREKLQTKEAESLRKEIAELKKQYDAKKSMRDRKGLYETIRKLQEKHWSLYAALYGLILVGKYDVKVHSLYELLAVIQAIDDLLDEENKLWFEVPAVRNQ